MPTAMTKEERAQASEKLAGKLAALREAVAARGVETPDRKLVSEFLTPSDLQGVWKMLERARGRKPTSVEEAWKSLTELGKAKGDDKKWHVLMSFVVGKDDDDWENNLMVYSEAVTLSNTRTKTGELLYRGEIDTMHGRKEAQQLIDAGIVKQVFYRG